MAAPANSAVRELQETIEHLRIKCAHGEGSFIPRQALRNYLTLDKLHWLLKTLNISFEHREAIYHNCWRVFVILILLGQHDKIPDFICRTHLLDGSLPFHRKDREKWPNGCGSFFDQFYDHQWQFCVEKWKRGRLTRLQLEKEALLPIVKEEILREGTNSNTWKIELCPEYNNLEPNSDVLVLKTCSLNDRVLYHNELTTYQRLMQQQDIQPNIVYLHGDFQHRNELHLILEFVNGGTLESLYKSPPPPLAQVSAFWSSFLKVYNPLLQLHELKYKGKEYKAIHQDIKPSNILVALDNASPGNGMTFKLIDFAFACFQEQNKNRDATVWDEGGTQMYSAPELCRNDRVLQSLKIPIEPSVDTWSFGAVLSETLVWCIMGENGLTKYRSSRLQATRGASALEQGGYEGCFHDGEHVLDVIENMHQEALDAAKVNAAKVDTGVLGILYDVRSLAERMLMDELSARPSDISIYRECQRIIKRADNFVQLPGDPSNSTRRIGRVMLGPDQTASPLRIVPPELPPAGDLSPGYDQRGLRPYSASIDGLGSVSPGSALSQEDRSYPPSLQGPSIHLDTPKNGDTCDRKLDDRHVAFAPPDPPERADNNGTPDFAYPDLTVKEVRVWIAKRKEKSQNPLMRTSPELDGLQILDDLVGRDQIFLFDNSPSMKSNWLGLNGVVETFEALGYLVKGCTPRKMGAVLTSSGTVWESKDRTAIVKKLGNPRLTEQSNMSYWLKRILKMWKTRQKTLFDTKRKPGLNLYIFTAGVWLEIPGSSTFCGIDEVIWDLFKEMRNDNVRPSMICIRFIRFGEDPVGSKRLHTLVEKFRSKEFPHDFWNVVDCEPQHGNVWKMLMVLTPKYQILWDTVCKDDTRWGVNNISVAITSITIRAVGVVPIGCQLRKPQFWNQPGAPRITFHLFTINQQRSFRTLEFVWTDPKVLDCQGSPVRST